MDGEDAPDELLVKLVKRAALLAQLRSGPREVTELVERLDASRSTVHRAVQSLVEAGAVRSVDGTCELTGFGRVVADEVAGFRSKVTGASRLKPFLNTADPDEVSVPVAEFADATVSHPRPRQPHFAVKRIIELIEDADSVEVCSSVVSPFYVNVAYREMLDGTEIEVVFEPEVVDIVATEYAEKARQVTESGNFDLLVRGNVPFELFVFDDSVGLAAHDDSGIARVFVEAEAPGAVEWAESLYDSFRSDAERVDVDRLQR